MWTNAAVKEMIDKYGHRICNMSLNNNKVLYIDYPGKDCVKLEDISFDNIGGVDVMVIQHNHSAYGKTITFKSYITTEFIEGINVMDEDYADYRIDPLRL